MASSFDLEAYLERIQWQGDLRPSFDVLADTPGGRVTVMNRDVTRWHGATPHVTQIADRAALRSLLNEHFGFDLPQAEQLQVPSIPQ